MPTLSTPHDALHAVAPLFSRELSNWRAARPKQRAPQPRPLRMVAALAGVHLSVASAASAVFEKALAAGRGDEDMAAMHGRCARRGSAMPAAWRPDTPNRSSAAQVGQALAPRDLLNDPTLASGPAEVHRRADAHLSTGYARGAPRRASVVSRPLPHERASAASAPGAPCHRRSTPPSSLSPPSTTLRRFSRPRARADATRTHRALRRPSSASRAARPDERLQLDARRAHACRNLPLTALDRRDALAFLSRMAQSPVRPPAKPRPRALDDDSLVGDGAAPSDSSALAAQHGRLRTTVLEPAATLDDPAVSALEVGGRHPASDLPRLARRELR